MATLNRDDFWSISFCFYPEAIADGLKPIRHDGFSDPPAGVAFYSVYTFHFESPPSRADFLQMGRSIPWMRQHPILDFIEQDKCDWPTIDYAHKAATVYLKNEQGVEIGRIHVHRERIYVNEPYATLFIDVNSVEQVIHGYKKEDREELRRCIDSKDNRIRENIANIRVREKRPVEHKDLIAELKRVVQEWKANRKANRKTAVPA